MMCILSMKYTRSNVKYIRYIMWYMYNNTHPEISRKILVFFSKAYHGF